MPLSSQFLLRPPCIGNVSYSHSLWCFSDFYYLFLFGLMGVDVSSFVYFLFAFYLIYFYFNTLLFFYYFALALIFAFVCIVDFCDVRKDICSRYVVDKLPKLLVSSLQKRKPVSDADHSTMLKSVFVQTDEQFLNEHKNVVKTCPAGSCGVSVLIRNDKLYVCNLGDSRVLLGSKGQKWSHTLLTNDHNTKNEKERQLVKQRTTDPNPIRGHMCQNIEGERVGGILMVTRAFGDGIFKRRDMSLHPLIKHLPYISNEPEVTIHKLLPTDTYAVISSDGLYEYLTPAIVAEVVEHHIENGHDLSKLCCALIEKQFEVIGKLVGKTADQVKKVPNRKTFMDDTSIIVLVFRHPDSTSSGAAAE
jgi:serine/threonine protein phosphatase PrpC